MYKKIVISFLSLLVLFVFSLKGQTPVANFIASDSVICAGDSVTFTDLSTNGPTSWSWTFAGGNPATSTVQNPEVYYGTAGVYTVQLTATNHFGSNTMTKTNYIVVNALPVITVSPPAAGLCAGGGIMMTASGAVSYNWAPVTGVACPTCATTNVNPPSNTTYTVFGTNGSGCTDSTTVVVTVGSVIATITGMDTICQNTTDSLYASGGLTYLWNTGATTTSIGVSPSTTTNYSVLVSSGTCVDSAFFTLTVLPAPLISITGTDSMCLGGNVTLTASGAINYFWAPSSGLSCTACATTVASPSVTTTYTVIGTNNSKCTNADTFTVHVIFPPVVSAGHAISICAGSQATLNASSLETGLFVWTPGNDTNSVFTTPVLSAGVYVYTVTLTGLCGSGSDTVTVEVLPSPTVKFNAAPLSGCTPLCVQFTDLTTITTGSIVTWDWTFGDTGTSSSKNPIYCYNKPGFFTVNLTVEGSDGCSSTLTNTDMISAYSPPIANFTYSPDPANIIDPTVNFTDASQDGMYRVVRWTWLFGDNTDSISYKKDAVHTYSDTGTYCPQLAIMDQNGCRDTVTKCFEVNPEFIFYIPSAFSPNGDGIDETFAAKGLDLKSFEMYIFDRWGMQLYHTTDINSGWNGVVGGGSGRICQEDTYVYKINVTDAFGNVHHYVGELQLIK